MDKVKISKLVESIHLTGIHDIEINAHGARGMSPLT
jgi:hypothetical protein